MFIHYTILFRNTYLICIIFLRKMWLSQSSYKEKRRKKRKSVYAIQNNINKYYFHVDFFFLRSVIITGKKPKKVSVHKTYTRTALSINNTKWGTGGGGGMFVHRTSSFQTFYLPYFSLFVFMSSPHIPRPFLVTSPRHTEATTGAAALRAGRLFGSHR